MRNLVLSAGVVAQVISAFAWDVEHDEVAQLTGEFLSVEIEGVRHPLKRDANGDGYAKPVCAQEISVGA